MKIIVRYILIKWKNALHKSEYNKVIFLFYFRITDENVKLWFKYDFIKTKTWKLTVRNRKNKTKILGSHSL